MAKTGLLTGQLPGGQGVLQGLQCLFVSLRFGLEQLRQQGAAARRPNSGGSWNSRCQDPVRQRLQQVRQGAGQLSLKTADLNIRLDSRQASRPEIHLICTTGITQQHALQPKPGAVLVAAGLQAKVSAVALVQSPANTRTRHPAGELGQAGRLNTKTCGDRSHLQQFKQLAHAATLLRQAQQPLQGRDQRAVGFRTHVRNIKRNKAGVGGFILAKNSPDSGRHGLNIGHHHDDIARVQCRRRAGPQGGLGQQLQQLVVQDFKLAHGAVGQVKHHGAVAVRHRRGSAARLCPGQGG